MREECFVVTYQDLNCSEDPRPDERARSLLEDLRENDPLAREIVDRVDRGAYGTKGRKANAMQASQAKSDQASASIARCAPGRALRGPAARKRLPARQT